MKLRACNGDTYELMVSEMWRTKKGLDARSEVARNNPKQGQASPNIKKSKFNNISTDLARHTRSRGRSIQRHILTLASSGPGNT